MAWRGLHLTQPSRLTLADGQIVVEQDDDEVRLPIEDIAWIVLDSPRATLTSSLLSACMSAGVAVVVTDETHTPCGIALPFHNHFRQPDVACRQVAMGTPFKKRLWQAIVRRKIANQADVLAMLGCDGADMIRAMSQHVGSGDPGNVEARAARRYWSRLWPEFRRGDSDDRRNKLLNYGYAVARAGVARSLVASGLLPAFGLSHRSVTNAFNLADDIVEPFRPFVDALAWRTADNGKPSRADLAVVDRQVMVGVLLVEAWIGTDSVTLLTAADRAATSLVRAIEAKLPDVLELPALNP